MIDDPILAEIRRIREELWDRCHGSVQEMAERQRQVQQQHAAQLIDPTEWKQRLRADAREAR